MRSDDFLFLISDCFFRQEDFNFAMQDYQQALEIDPLDETIKSRISVIHNEFGVTAYQEKMFAVSETASHLFYCIIKSKVSFIKTLHKIEN